MGQVLQIVDREDDGPSTHQWCRPATMVHEIGSSGPSSQPRVLGEHPSRSLIAGDAGGDHRVQLGQLGVGVDERGQAVEGGDELGGLRCESDQLADQVLLGATDVTRNAPEQVHGDIDR